MYQNNYSGDRYFFFPFLVGAVAGGAAVGLTRPRPIVNANPVNQYPKSPYPINNPYQYPINYNSYYPTYYYR